jgi:hypothetical protein
MQSSLATKDDFHALRTEMQASRERILTLLYQHKLEFQQALATQREDFIRRWRSSASISTPHWQNSAKSFYAALAETKLDLHKALIGHIGSSTASPHWWWAACISSPAMCINYS